MPLIDGDSNFVLEYRNVGDRRPGGVARLLARRKNLVIEVRPKISSVRCSASILFEIGFGPSDAHRKAASWDKIAKGFLDELGICCGMSSHRERVITDMRL
jgi:hypothetical protein